jgi:alpha-N-arabinofuranosidase
MGHPAPFNLDRIGVGNEQWGPQYMERYAPFAKAIKQRYPDIKLIAAAGPFPEGKDFDFAWKQLRGMPVDFIDEHYYADPSWFPANVHRYDNYDRNGPKVFAGEFAAQSVAIASPKNRNNWQSALSEAAFMTGLERNSDVVAMASYAPLFGHVDGWQWTPNLIWFDNLRSYGTPNYYVQKLFSTQIGTTILPVQIADDAKKLFGCATRDDQSGDVILKLVNMQSAAVPVEISLAGLASTGALSAEEFVLSSDDLKAENSLDQPTKIAPVETAMNGLSPQFTRELAPYSLTVMRIHR